MERMAADGQPVEQRRRLPWMGGSRRIAASRNGGAVELPPHHPTADHCQREVGDPVADVFAELPGGLGGRKQPRCFEQVDD